MEHQDYIEAIDILRQTDTRELELLCDIIENFPHGKDAFIGRYWIINAIDCGSIETVQWILSKDVELKFEDDDTPLESSIQRDLPNKYEILKMLIQAGADIHARGMNDYTPLHLAATKNDQIAMKILIESGADKTIRTRIDDLATPEEEARNLGSIEGADFLAKLKN